MPRPWVCICGGRVHRRGGKRGTGNSPTIINVAYYTTQFWDGRENTLEKQAEGPVQNPVEMAHSLAGVVARLIIDRKRTFETALTAHLDSEVSTRIRGSGSGQLFLGEVLLADRVDLVGADALS
jgi:cytochrome c peroxidase